METIKFALRALRQSPGFSLLAILALGLGIGANSAIFSIINAIFLRPLPYAQPEQIVQVTSTEAERQLNQVAMSWPRLDRCSAVGQPQNPSPPKPNPTAQNPSPPKSHRTPTPNRPRSLRASGPADGC